MEQGIGYAPLLPTAHQGDRLIVQPQDLPATLLMVAIHEPDNIPDGDFIPPKALPGLLADLDICAIKVDGRVRNQPAFLRGKIENDRLLASQLQYLTLLGTVRGRVEILDGLADPQPRANGIHPARLIKDTINGGSQTKELKGRGAVEGSNSFGEFHRYWKGLRFCGLNGLNANFTELPQSERGS